jgi:hypothetical protein
MIKYSTEADAYLFKVIDLDTGLEIPHCLFANDETGDYEVYICDENGEPKFVGRDYLTEKRKGNIKLVKKEH